MTAALDYLFNYCAHATFDCFKAWTENTVRFFGGAASIAAGVPLCATGPGCVAGASMTVIGSQEVGEAVNWVIRGDEETRGFNLLREGARQVSADIFGAPRYGEAAYHGVAALTTGYAGVVGVSVPKWSPLLNDFLWVTEPRWSTLNILQRGSALGSVGASAYKGTSALFGP